MAIEGTQETVEWPIEVRPNGTVIYGGIAIGGLDFSDGQRGEARAVPAGEAQTMAPRLTLNLGWMRAAGIHLTVEGDPRVDTKRGGIVLER